MRQFSMWTNTEFVCSWNNITESQLLIELRQFLNVIQHCKFFVELAMPTTGSQTLSYIYFGWHVKKIPSSNPKPLALLLWATSSSSTYVTKMYKCRYSPGNSQLCSRILLYHASSNFKREVLLLFMLDPTLFFLSWTFECMWFVFYKLVWVSLMDNFLIPTHIFVSSVEFWHTFNIMCLKHTRGKVATKLKAYRNWC